MIRTPCPLVGHCHKPPPHLRQRPETFVLAAISRLLGHLCNHVGAVRANLVVGALPEKIEVRRGHALALAEGSTHLLRRHNYRTAEPREGVYPAAVCCRYRFLYYSWWWNVLLRCVTAAVGRLMLYRPATGYCCRGSETEGEDKYPAK